MNNQGKKQLTGLGGWLIFFLIVFILGIAGALFQVFRILLAPIYYALITATLPNATNLIIPRPHIALTILLLILYLGLSGLYLKTVLSLVKKKQNTKKYAIISIWTAYIITLIDQLILYTILPKTAAFQNALRQAPIGLDAYTFIFYIITALIVLSGLVWAILITVYFTKSRRVKNTLIN